MTPLDCARTAATAQLHWEEEEQRPLHDEGSYIRAEASTVAFSFQTDNRLADNPKCQEACKQTAIWAHSTHITIENPIFMISRSRHRNGHKKFSPNMSGEAARLSAPNCPMLAESDIMQLRNTPVNVNLVNSSGETPHKSMAAWRILTNLSLTPNPLLFTTKRFHKRTDI